MTQIQQINHRPGSLSSWLFFLKHFMQHQNDSCFKCLHQIVSFTPLCLDGPCGNYAENPPVLWSRLWRDCSCSSWHKRVLFHYFCRAALLVVRQKAEWMLCTHRWYTQSLYNDISEKSQCNQLRLAKSITTTINLIKYARSANVAWSRSVAQGRLWAQGLSKCTLSVLTCRLKDPLASLCLICLPDHCYASMGRDIAVEFSQSSSCNHVYNKAGAILCAAWKKEQLLGNYFSKD